MLTRPKAAKTRRPRRKEWKHQRDIVVSLWFGLKCPVCKEVPLWVWPPSSSGQGGRWLCVAKVDHLIAERIIRKWHLGKPHSLINLLPVCAGCHSKKTAIEKHLEASDLLRFRQEVNRLGWPMDKIDNALRHFGLMRAA